MNMDVINAFMSGAITMGFAAIAVFFFRSWRRSRISLLGLFGLAFALLAFERAVLLLVEPEDEFRPFIYLIRLGAFLVIIVGIVMHNRRSA